MISYTLKCANDHLFESWFQSGAAYDSLLKAGQISCALCGDTAITKSLMAPGVQTARQAATAPPSLSEPQNETEKALTKMRKTIEDNSDYVGMSFASEARKMHLGDSPERAIYGEAKPEEARALIEEGIPVAPLPFMPKRSTN